MKKIPPIDKTPRFYRLIIRVVIKFHMTKDSNDSRLRQFETWFAEYCDSILRMCFAYLGNSSLAEDALQDTFVKVWRNMDGFQKKNECSAKTWIMRIAINTCKDYKRSAWFRHVDPYMTLEKIPLVSCNYTEESRTVFFDVIALPNKYKEVVLLYYYQRMSMAEVGYVLKLSRSTVQNRLQKAHAFMRSQREGWR
ncbi:MAG: sigma-70 family RNA polymerase sigma factor [Eubacteriales bacterium]|nr:sigma-70 family RNA polymerase sigma factor [Eubacteriales bacterium]